jgi:protein-S-isoprenylcysteine O-methyltransferase Ste14
MKAAITIVYGIFSYAIFLASLVYAFGFMANLWVPWPMDAIPRSAPGRALLIDLCLVVLVATHHCLLKKPLSRHAFLRGLPVELEYKSCFLVSGACMLLLFRFWQPVGRIAWDVEHGFTRLALWAGFAAGCLLVLVTALFLRGRRRDELAAAWAGIWKGLPGIGERRLPPSIGNPLYAGWLLVFWCVPTMTLSHLWMSSIATVFVALAFVQETRFKTTGESQ